MGAQHCTARRIYAQPLGWATYALRASHSRSVSKWTYVDRSYALSLRLSASYAPNRCASYALRRQDVRTAKLCAHNKRIMCEKNTPYAPKKIPPMSWDWRFIFRLEVNFLLYLCCVRSTCSRFVVCWFYFSSCFVRCPPIYIGGAYYFSLRL